MSSSQFNFDIVDIVYIDVLFSVYIVDIINIAMWTIYTRYRVNIIYIDVLYPVYIVDIAMWRMYTQYCVNIVHIDVLSCLHRRYCLHRD